MKDIFKFFGLLLVGLFVAIILYPFLHESGHLVAAILVRAKVLDFNLLPLPYVMCDVSGVNTLGQAIIGFGGIIIPLVLTSIIKLKNFWFWYAQFLIKCISVYAVILSFIVVILYNYGFIIGNDDIIQVLKIFPNGTGILIMSLGLIITYGIFALKKQKPLMRCLNYFGVIDNKVISNKK